MRYYKIGNDIYQLNYFRGAVTVTYFIQASFRAKLNIKSVKINEPPLRLEETCSICDDLDGDSFVYMKFFSLGWGQRKG